MRLQQTRNLLWLVSGMRPTKGTDGETSALRAFLLMRYTLIAATAYLLIVEESFAVPPLMAILPVVVALASNVVLGRIGEEKLRSAYIGTALIISDTAWITVALIASGRFSGDFFYLYFLVLLLAALGERLEMIALGAVAVCGAYFYLLTASGNWSMWSSPSLIRIPFLATAAFFYGFLVDRTRHERRRADARTDELSVEAQVSSALLRVSREMISSLDRPVILDRLCQVTAEVLRCDTSHTLLWNPSEQVFVPLASHGASAEHAESLRLLQIPRTALGDLIAGLEADEVVSSPSAGGALPAALGIPTGAAMISMALRRGDEIIGIHTAARRRAGDAFAALYERIARGISQTASMALANARLFEELEKANRVKSDFVATMSHELRTPLNQIIGYTDLLLENSFGPLGDEQAGVLRRVSHSSCELLAMIQATLDLSRLEAREIELHLESVNAADVLRELDAETRYMQEKPNLAFEWRVGGNLPPLCTDPLKLKMVLKNLVANAAKFTDRGTVVVAAEPSQGGVEFSVRDTGSGIPPEAHEAIFQPFWQVSSDTGVRGGVGLGLYIVRRLVDILQGSITCESEVGRGSTFRVWLGAQGESIPSP